MSVVDNAWHDYINKTEAAPSKTQRKNAKKRAKEKEKIAAAQEPTTGTRLQQHIAIDCCAAQRNNGQQAHPTAQQQDADYRLLSPTMESARAAIEPIPQTTVANEALSHKQAQVLSHKQAQWSCPISSDRNTGKHTDALEHQVRTPHHPAEQHDSSRGSAVYDQLWQKARAKALEDPDRSAEALHTSTVAIFRHLKKKHKSTEKKWHKRHS